LSYGRMRCGRTQGRPQAAALNAATTVSARAATVKASGLKSRPMPEGGVTPMPEGGRSPIARAPGPVVDCR